MHFKPAVVLATFAVMGLGAIAAPVGLGLKSARGSSVSVVTLIDKAQSRMDQALTSAHIDKSSTLDPTTLNNIISTTNDVSNTLATDLTIVDRSLDTLMVDTTGNRLTNEELATKVITLLKAFETACLTAKSMDIGEIANIMELIALNIDDISDGLHSTVPDVTFLPALVNGFKATDASISQIVASIPRHT